MAVTTGRPTESAFRDHLARAAAHYGRGELADAEAAYRAALALSPGRAAVAHNLGVVVAARGRHQEALGYFDAALAADPHYVSAHYNRAVALAALGRSEEAISGFSRACALEPEHYDAHRALGFLWLAQGERGRSLDHFARTYDLRRGDDRTTIAIRSLTSTSRHKLLHDAEQFRYLSQRLRDRLRFEILARNYEDVAKGVPEQTVALSDEQIDILGEDYNTAIHVRSAPELAGGTLGARADHDAIAEQFQRRGAVGFDDLLSPPALAALTQYLLESTIWHDFDHIGGFVASYLEDGLACPLLLQIVDEIRAAFPDLLKDHPLSQAWAFKGLQPSAAIDAHADDAAISVNFWVTPTAANRNPDHGGMVVCCVPPPAGWQVSDYHADQERVVTFLEQNAGNSLTVPYCENRAVLFRSRLFHYSDAPDFAPGYENHRISVTLLFGHHAGGEAKRQ
jgi:tetratricopeptide (TPR) repeat protein